MKFLRYALLAAAILTSLAALPGAGAARGQERVQDSPLLFAELKIQPYVGELTNTKRTFKEGRPVTVSITAKNTNSIPIVVQVTSLKFVQYSPRLIKDGQLVGYAAGVEDRIKAQNDPVRASNKYREIAPGEEGILDALDLTDWYGQLKPGVYELTMTCRFPRNAHRESDNVVTFEVLP
jgi:hypothetical protein